jgi:hypothetical protein
MCSGTTVFTARILTEWLLCDDVLGPEWVEGERRKEKERIVV